MHHALRLALLPAAAPFQEPWIGRSHRPRATAYCGRLDIIDWPIPTRTSYRKQPRPWLDFLPIVRCVEDSRGDRVIYESVPALTSEELKAGLTASSPTAARPSINSLWGIDWVQWLLAVRIRILFVIDGRITTGDGPQDFGLGPVIRTLRTRWPAWWVRFSVTVVDRDPPESFRFTREAFDIDDFDQVWFFGDWPGTAANSPDVSDDIIQRPEFSPMEDAELRIIAEWMERGGGVFSTGDHSLLGASMCSRIPRVRNMRKWTRAQGVPTFADSNRNQTLVRDPQTGELQWEGDRWAQQIFPVYRSGGPVVFHQFPHPLLCGRAGPIDRFPDHMHEGSVIEDSDVPLKQPLAIPGYDGVEFPVVEPVLQGVTAFSPEVFGVQPRPQVIAHALTRDLESEARRFAVVGVYDGEAVKVGRVVVDSTWHHWFSMNLIGFQAEVPSIFAGMQDYYRNVGLWLATPQQRAAMLILATWGVLVGKHPGAFDRAMGIWDLGERVVDAIGRTAPQCIVNEFSTTFLPLRESQSPTSAQESAAIGGRRPARLKPSVALTNEAIVGGMAFELLELAHQHIRERALGRPTEVDGPEILRRGMQGVRTGIRELVATLNESCARVAKLDDAVRDPFRQDMGHYKSGDEQ